MNGRGKMKIMMIMFICSGTLLSLLAVPMITRKIPPNGLYGFRVKKTMENPEIWYPVNAYSGKWLFLTGITMVISALVIKFIPGISIDVYAYSNLAVWGITFTVAIIDSIRYLNSL
jgi:hypothetical protein